MSYYNNYDNDWSNTLFISNPEDMKKEIELKDLGKEIFFLTKHAFCETCSKTLKAFASEAKAQAKVDKHLATKKYAGHKAIVKTVDFSEFRRCTTADIFGTKANIDRNESLRNKFYVGVRSKIEQEIASHEEVIKKVQKAFSLPNRNDDIPRCPRDLDDGKVRLSSEDGRTVARIKAKDFTAIEELFDGTWGKEKDYDKDCYNRAGMIIYYIKLDGYYNSEKIYSWEYPTVYDDFVGFDKLVGECIFCHKDIENWNDSFAEGISREYLHRECYKHFQEQKNLERYAERYAEKLEQEVTTS